MQNTEQTEYYSRLTFPVEPDLPDNVPSPNNPPWNSLSALGLWIASILFILIIPGLFLIPYLLTKSPPITENEQFIEFAKSDPGSIVIQIAAIIPAHLLTLLLAWAIATRMRTYSAGRTLGMEKGGFVWWHYCIILASFFAIAALVNTVVPEQQNELIRILQSSRAAVYIVAFVATFTAPIAEEVVYRGILYSAFQRTLGVPLAFLMVTFLFAIVHVPQYYPSFSTIFLLVLLSLTLTAIRVKTENLLPCIILHTLFNGMQSILLIIEPFLKPAEVQEQTASVFNLLK